ncbi:MAG: circadian clock protein KaiC [Desulfococcaceae bacterium]
MHGNTIEKLPTGIAGFDELSRGGLPKRRTTLLSGTAGCGKTIFAVQFLAQGIRSTGETGVFVTFEEAPADIRRNVLGFGWDLDGWETEGKLRFVDGSPDLGDETLFSGGYDLGALLARITYAVRTIDARRVTMDSLGALFSRYENPALVRNELFRIGATLKEMGVTSLVTSERTEDYGEISRYGVEEFVSDNVVVMRNLLEEERRLRTIEILKFRGADHDRGEAPYTISGGEGIVVVPLCQAALDHGSPSERISSGNEELDRMCGDGFYSDAAILVSGATGTGKTLMVTEFMSAAAETEERALLVAFEEGPEQIFRNAAGWGYDFAKLRGDGRLKVICAYPESASMEEHFLWIQAAIAEFRPHRIAVDSLSALERVANVKRFREFMIGLTGFLKQRGIAAMFTATTPALLGGVSITEAHISTITDAIILLRYVELFGEMHRGLTVLKMRGSRHDKEIRSFAIDGGGMHIGRAFRNVGGIIEGRPVHVAGGEIERIQDLFQ